MYQMWLITAISRKKVQVARLWMVNSVRTKVLKLHLDIGKIHAILRHQVLQLVDGGACADILHVDVVVTVFIVHMNTSIHCVVDVLELLVCSRRGGATAAASHFIENEF